MRPVGTPDLAGGNDVAAGLHVERCSSDTSATAQRNRLVELVLPEVLRVAARTVTQGRIVRPVFVVEREFAESFDPDGETLRLVDEYHLDNEIKWITSFLSADKKKTYCLYEAENADVLRKHAADLGLPADVITQVDEFVR